MANLYIDCEFNSFQGELISMALVSECGKEWYEVARCDQPYHAWVAEHVVPLLDKSPIAPIHLTESLQMFLAQFDAVHIVADWPEDIAYFCNALIIGAGQRINTPPLTLEVRRDDCPSKLPHNALADARGLKDYYHG